MAVREGEIVRNSEERKRGHRGQEISDNNVRMRIDRKSRMIERMKK